MRRVVTGPAEDGGADIVLDGEPPLGRGALETGRSACTARRRAISGGFSWPQPRKQASPSAAQAPHCTGSSKRGADPGSYQLRQARAGGTRW